MPYYKPIKNEAEERQRLKNLILLLTEGAPSLPELMARLPDVSGPTIATILSELVQEGKLETQETPPS